jgi:peptidoglycan hydrolase-like protein with peptidoglycan-binding domain
MLRRLFVLAMLLLLALSASVPARAATAISYSPDGNAYGWCAGYSSARAPSCAAQYCEENKGTNCQSVLTCPDAWGAVAFAEDPAIGFSADCGLSNAAYARGEALAACIVASYAYCWTDATFDRNANTRSKDDNNAFDLVWYAQSLLQLTGYLKGTSDGVLGPSSRDALAKFRSDVGLPASDGVDLDTIHSLLDADAGMANFVRQLKRDIVDPHHQKLAGYLYANAATPNPSQTFSQELVERSDVDRRTALATYLSAEGEKCTLPAANATAIPDASSGVWDVDCAENDYTLFLTGDGASIVTTKSKSAPADDANPTGDTGKPADTAKQADAPSGNAASGTGDQSASATASDGSEGSVPGDAARSFTPRHGN